MKEPKEPTEPKGSKEPTGAKENEDRLIKLIQGILGIMMAGAFIFFIACEILLPPENTAEGKGYGLFAADWEQVMEDGSTVPVEVPGEYAVERGKWMTIRTQLPTDQESTWLCIRSLQQEIRAYVGDELRKEYSTLDTQPFGKTSTIAYVFIRLTKEDAGRELRLELASDSSYSGFVSEIYEGDRGEIWQHFMGLYAPATGMAAFMLLLGIAVVCACHLLHFVYGIEVELLHLGNAILLASSWLIAESRLRQFFLPNSTAAMYMGFFIIMLLPYPVSAYLNLVQKRRYQKLYLGIEVCAGINFIVVTLLQVSHILDFFETMWVSHVIILSLAAIITAAILCDICMGRIREYREVAMGFGALMLAGICEIYMVYVYTPFGGIPLCLSLIFLLLMAGVRTAKNIVAVEREKQSAIAAGESKAKFLANMSHEIRTPINTVIGMNEMILRESQDETVLEYAHSIKDASQMLMVLIDDVLDFSKMEAGKMQLVESEYQTAFMLKDVLLGIEPKLKKKELSLQLEIDENLPAVLWGDGVRIRQILNNILSNAVKYTEKGSVSLSVKGIRGSGSVNLLMTVRDTGIGIRQEDMEKLFDSFQRLELQKNRYIEGSGLGLNIVKQLVDLMNGTIAVESEYGKGSCFVVQIPQQIVDGAPMGSLEQSQRQTSRTEPAPEEILYAPDARILAVDDNKLNLKVVGALLKRSEIQVDFAAGGEECLQLTREKQYDLILMDHMMPEPDGIQTLHLLRGEKGNPNQLTKVIVLTANVIAGAQEEYLAEGFVDYLPKPLKVDQLEQTLAKHLQGKIKKQRDEI